MFFDNLRKIVIEFIYFQVSHKLKYKDHKFISNLIIEIYDLDNKCETV